jgi:hypothetical protein
LSEGNESLELQTKTHLAWTYNSKVYRENLYIAYNYPNSEMFDSMQCRTTVRREASDRESHTPVRKHTGYEKIIWTKGNECVATHLAHGLSDAQIEEDFFAATEDLKKREGTASQSYCPSITKTFGPLITESNL